jgi:hypothetical protein
MTRLGYRASDHVRSCSNPKHPWSRKNVPHDYVRANFWIQSPERFPVDTADWESKVRSPQSFPQIPAMAHGGDYRSHLARGTEPRAPNSKSYYWTAATGAPLWPGLADRTPTGKISGNLKKSQHGPLGPNRDGRKPFKIALKRSKRKAHRFKRPPQIRRNLAQTMQI